MGLSGLSSIVRSRPLLHVQLLKLRNLSSKARLDLKSPRHWLVALVALFAVYSLASFVRSNPFEFRAELDTLEGKLLLGILVAGAFAMATSARYRRISETLPNVWLASTRSVNALSFTQRLTTSLWPLVLISAGMLCIAWLVTPADQSDVSLSLTVITSLAVIIGILTGLYMGMRPAHRKRRSSRYIRNSRLTSASLTHIASNRSALSLLPVREAQAMAQPANSRLLFLAALMTLPAGISGVMIIVMLAGWALLAWLFTLAVAVPDAAARARRWLHSTTLPFRTFWWLLVRRAVLHFGIAAIVIGPLCLLLDATLIEAIRVISFCLLLFLAWSTFTVLAVWQGRDDRWMGGIGAIVVTTLENRIAGFGSLIGLLVTAVCLRRGVRDAGT